VVTIEVVFSLLFSLFAVAVKMVHHDLVHWDFQGEVVVAEVCCSLIRLRTSRRCRNWLSPMHFAASAGHTSCIEFFITNNADLNIQDGFVLIQLAIVHSIVFHTRVAADGASPRCTGQLPKGIRLACSFS
jgi:hypothetical protein